MVIINMHFLAEFTCSMNHPISTCACLVQKRDPRHLLIKSYLMKQNIQIACNKRVPECENDNPSLAHKLKPLLASLDQFQGYESITFFPVDVEPPKTAIDDYEQRKVKENGTSLFDISKNDAKKLFIRTVSGVSLCSNPIKSIDIVKIELSSAFHYKLETFTERRQICWAFESYKSGLIDLKGNTPIPMAWEVSSKIQPLPFEDHIELLKIPHTESLVQCHDCGALGRRRCTICIGTGWERCTSCDGDGVKMRAFSPNEMDKCYACNAFGRRKCWPCNGRGTRKCKTCKGSGQLRCFIRLKIIRSNHSSNFVTNCGEIPADRLIRGSGDTVYEETRSKLTPLEQFPNALINQASREMLENHFEKHTPHERIIMQRQHLIYIPLATVFYRYRNELNIFWVYGHNRQIYAPEYPTKCCLCNIL